MTSPHMLITQKANGHKKPTQRDVEIIKNGAGTLERLRRIWMEKVMTSMQGTLRLQLRMSVKTTSVAPLSTKRSQHTGDSLVAVSDRQNR